MEGYRGWNLKDQIKLTHVPTGLSVCCDVERGRWKQANQRAKSMLAARVARPEPQVTEIIRTYDLNPPLGIEPNIHTNRPFVGLASGMDEVQRWLDGGIPLPIIPAG